MFARSVHANAYLLSAFANSRLTPLEFLTELDVPALRCHLARIVDELTSSPDHAYHSIPTVAYGLSKLGVNVYAQVASRTMTFDALDVLSIPIPYTQHCIPYTSTSYSQYALQIFVPSLP